MRVAIWVHRVRMWCEVMLIGIHLLCSLPIPYPDIRLERLNTKIFAIRLLLVRIIEHCYNIVVFEFKVYSVRGVPKVYDRRLTATQPPQYMHHRR